MIYRIYSPCKINLHLDVHEKRPDGYHDLTSIFQMVSLLDIIDLEFTKSNKIILNGDFDCSLEDNLIYKAVVAFLKAASIEQGMIITVDKKIPAGGGIGGGSGNCGAILRGLNQIFDNVLQSNKIFELALNLGSDVPFFLGTGTALVEGRGEVITPIKTVSDYFIVLVNPSIHISTAFAFKKLAISEEISRKNSVNIDFLLTKYSEGPKKFKNFKNSFELGLFSDYTFIRDIKRIMYRENAMFSALSGSGSTMFGIFNKLETAESAIESLKKHNHNYKIYLVKPLEDFPELEIK